jgi:hypothetical protein
MTLNRLLRISGKYHGTTNINVDFSTLIFDEYLYLLDTHTHTHL